MFGFVDHMWGVAGTATNWLPILAFAVGLAFAALCGLILLDSFRARATHSLGLRAGLAVWGLVAGLYLVFTALDHWWFYRGTSEYHGHAAVAFLDVREVQCDVALTRHEEGSDAVEYRCPTLLMFKQLYSAPFVPWPSYVSGSSVELKAKIDKLIRSAEKVQ
ncbi:hypothetical protein LJR175_008418 [Variovorax sp. LjRoot175]|uniref:hypothetical protein n=1 Tax=Variovorax sp. LjRoot175 TaxID=3342276 RepID=UPI003ECD54A4